MSLFSTLVSVVERMDGGGGAASRGGEGVSTVKLNCSLACNDMVNMVRPDNEVEQMSTFGSRLGNQIFIPM